MDATEFRIGNRIQTNKIEVIVTGVQKRVLISTDPVNQYADCIYTNMGTCYDNEAEPIPLTEECLKRVEEVIRYEDGWFFINATKRYDRPVKIRLKQTGESWYVSLWDEMEECVIHEGKYHVHKLQNLYFILSGRELKIK